MLITPIITLSIQGLQGTDLNQGTALTNMTRQLGGAVGIAVINLYISHRQSIRYTDLASQVNEGHEVTQQLVSRYTQFYATQGYSPGNAQQLSYQALGLAVEKQALLLSYLDSFAFVGVLCILVIPLVFLLNNPKGVQYQAHLGE